MSTYDINSKALISKLPAKPTEIGPKVMMRFLMLNGCLHYKLKIMLGFFVFCLMACDVSNNASSQRQQGEDPVIVDYPIAFVARRLPLDEEGNVQEQDILNPAAFYPGARLIIKDRATSAALETDITRELFPNNTADQSEPNSATLGSPIDIKDLAPSYDGTTLLFALRAPADPNLSDNEQPTWNIWQYALLTQELKQLIPPSQAELGQDVAPQYLPDGRIVFTSTRQKRTKALLLDENKAQYAGQDEDLDADAFNLHIYDPISESISQITFNPSHDLLPTVLSDGRIMFLRWDNMLNNDQLSFYTIYPDGTKLQKLYGYNSQNTGPNGIEATFWQAHEINDGQLLVNLRARQSRHWGGDVVTINTNNFIDVNTPNPQNPGSGSAQQSLSPLAVNISEAANVSQTEPKPLSMGGFYNSAFALNDGTQRFITSWSPCRLLSPNDNKTYPCEPSFRNLPNITTAPPNFGLWVLNSQTGTLKPIKPATEGEIYTQAVVFTQNRFL